MDENIKNNKYSDASFNNDKVITIHTGQFGINMAQCLYGHNN